MPSLIHPVDPKYISQWYGAEFAGKINNVWYDKVYKQLFGLDGGHPGIDYAVGSGTPVKAAADGVIEFAGWGANYHSTVGGGSYTVVIDHGTYYTAYLHLTAYSNKFTKGGKVKQGQIIALSGATGQGTGAHLHWQYMPKPVNFWDGRWGTRDQRKYITTVNVASIKQEDALSAAEVKEIKDFIREDNNRVLAAVGGRVWSYDQQGKTPQAWHFQKNVGRVVWAEKLKSRDGKLYSAAAFIVNNNANIWTILPLVKSIATAFVKKVDLEAAVKEINDNTVDSLANSVIDVTVTVEAKDKIDPAAEEVAK